MAEVPAFVGFDEWTGGREIPFFGTNSGAPALPFQSWRRFKEAFAPELIARAASESRRPVSSCIDPFGGSGTTALAAQFLGLEPITAEVNPYLADLIEAKVSSYDSDALAIDLSRVCGATGRPAAASTERFQELPRTFVEPGVGGRWLFDRQIAAEVAALLDRIERVPTHSHRRLFRILLGGLLVDASNVIISGKGRRYRRRWQDRRRRPGQLARAFRAASTQAIVDINRFRRRRCTRYTVLRQDSRFLDGAIPNVDLAVFSPPYPNSFDYTDVYNIELWLLGYLHGAAENTALRQATLTSHVQILREYAPAPKGSSTLAVTLQQLESVRGQLWSRWIPEMVGAYFTDLMKVITTVQRSLRPGGSQWIVVGDSRYAGVHIPTAVILGELATNHGLSIRESEPFRSMRSSAQQGGERALAETLVVLET